MRNAPERGLRGVSSSDRCYSSTRWVQRAGRPASRLEATRPRADHVAPTAACMRVHRRAHGAPDGPGHAKRPGARRPGR